MLFSVSTEATSPKEAASELAFSTARWKRNDRHLLIDPVDLGKWHRDVKGEKLDRFELHRRQRSKRCCRHRILRITT